MNSRARFILMAVLTMVGTIIGAGIFALPAAFAAVGFWPGTALFWILALASGITHVLFAGLLLNEKQRMRLTGLVDRQLDPVFHVIAQITYPLQIVASIFAYLILGGEFLSVLTRSIGIQAPVGLWQLVFWVVGGATVLFGLKAVARINTVATSAKMAALLLAVVIAWPLVDAGFVRAGSWVVFFTRFRDCHRWGKRLRLFEEIKKMLSGQWQLVLAFRHCFLGYLAYRFSWRLVDIRSERFRILFLFCRADGLC
jgi:amino acid permease